MDKDKRKHRYVEGLGILIIMLALVRCAFPGISTQPVAQVSEAVDSLKADTVITAQTEVPTEEPAPKPDNQVPETKPVPEAKPVPETTKPVATSTASTSYCMGMPKLVPVMFQRRWTEPVPTLSALRLLI